MLSRFALGLYSLAINLLAPPALLLSLPLLLAVRKRRKTLLPRLGLQAYPGSSPFLHGTVWIHALSVGELISGIPVIRELRTQLPDRPLVLSVSTLAAREIAEEKVGAYVDGLFYFPYDLVFAVRRCLSKIRPEVFILIETDIWPGFLAELRRLSIPCFLLNGRLSQASFRLSKILSALFTPAFNTFSGIYPQSPEEAERFRDLGVEERKIRRSGNLKFDLTGAPRSLEEIGEMRRRLGFADVDRVLLAGSTHPGEEAMLRSVFRQLRTTLPQLKLIIAPRHPRRAAEISDLFNGDPFRIVRFSLGPSALADIVVVDVMGVLGSLYAIADVAFVGGSLVKKGGQNPIEPAAAGRPILFGPDMSDFPDVSRLLLKAGGAMQVGSDGELLEQCRRVLGDPRLAESMGIRARSLVEQHRGAAERIAGDLALFLRAREA